MQFGLKDDCLWNILVNDICVEESDGLVNDNFDEDSTIEERVDYEYDG